MPVTSNGGAEVDRSFRSGLILLAGIALLATALAIQVILLETVVWTVVLAGAGVLLSAWGAFALRTELGEVVQRRRGEIALYTLGMLGVLIALAYLSTLYPFRFDLTQARLYSLSSATVTMLKRLDQPRSEEHTSELQSQSHISYAVFCLKKKIHRIKTTSFNNSQVMEHLFQ